MRGGLEAVEEFEKKSDRRSPLKCPREDLGQGPVRQHNRFFPHGIGLPLGRGVINRPFTHFLRASRFSPRGGAWRLRGGVGGTWIKTVVLSCLCIDRREGWTPSFSERPTLMSSRG